MVVGGSGSLGNVNVSANVTMIVTVTVTVTLTVIGVGKEIRVRIGGMPVHDRNLDLILVAVMIDLDQSHLEVAATIEVIGRTAMMTVGMNGVRNEGIVMTNDIMIIHQWVHQLQLL
ncbi:hypothetical protein NE237_024630 [Protea cynaroides]|uniref:Uncharacterized protein n=1 Tax=Protea cynaroides TaxID=273540 RepID=A0A9Q0H5I7_9MAGN|nr:hypothetical protein NE237_024630 [Protea cynaroides]